MSVGALVQSAPAPVRVKGSDAAYLELRRAAATLAAHGAPPPYTPLVLAVRLSEAHYDGPLLRAFLQALTRGADAARIDPHAATAAVAANRRLDGRFELALAQNTMAVAYPTGAGEPYGFQDSAAWQALGNWMAVKGLLHGGPPAATALTNEFLPGQGE